MTLFQDLDITGMQAEMHEGFAHCCIGAAAVCALAALPIAGIVSFELSLPIIALGFLFAMRAVSASRRADSIYARAAAAALAEGADPIAMSEAA